jgi:23S rRNA (uracil1939-C5)-methyltransferase
VESLVVLRPAPVAPIEILHEDTALLVANKPPHLSTVPEAEHEHSLLSLLRAQCGLPELTPVHRLDAGTSGVCLFAKQREQVAALAARLAAGDKHYLALVRGALRAKGIVRAPLRERGVTRPAVTRYLRLERVGGHSLARVRPEQGRTHQVRKHLAAIDHPLLGDSRYGDAASNRYFEHRFGLDRQFLHCARIELKEPSLKLEAELAPDLVRVLAALRVRT